MDEIYIKMCVAAQDDLRRNWTPKVNDRVLTRWNSDKNKLEIDYYSKDFVTKKASVLLHHRTDVWLPRQEDLQQIWLDKINENIWFLFRDFGDYIQPCWENSANESFNTIWLCFVMETCYNKRWNGETWEML